MNPTCCGGLHREKRADSFVSLFTMDLLSGSRSAMLQNNKEYIWTTSQEWVLCSARRTKNLIVTKTHI